MGLIGRGGPAPRRRARSLEAGLLRLHAAHARTRPHAGKWGGGGSPFLVTRRTRAFRGRAPTCGWAATARLAIARAAVRMRLHAAAHAGTSAGRAGSRVVSTRTCRTRRAGAGATGSVRGGCAGVPQDAAAAAAAPSSAARAAGFWVLGVGVLARWRWRADLALRSRCTRAALALRYTHAGLRGAGAVGSPRRRRQLPLLFSPLLLSLCRHHPC